MRTTAHCIIILFSFEIQQQQQQRKMKKKSWNIINKSACLKLDWLCYIRYYNEKNKFIYMTVT